MDKKKSSRSFMQELHEMKLNHDIQTGKLVKFGSSTSAYDKEYYDDPADSGNYVKELPQEDEDDDGITYFRKNFERGSWADAAGAMDNPERFKQELALHGKDVDPFRDTRAKKLKDREDSYRSRWRNRRISPPRADPYADDAPSSARTFKDIMKETFIEKDHQVYYSHFKSSYKTDLFQ